MKKFLKDKINLILLGVIILIIIMTIILWFNENSGMPRFLYNLIYEAVKALIVTLIIGSVGKIISEEIIKIKKNDEKMKKIGIYSIGEGLLDNKQANIMFGSKHHKYPKSLKFYFISGVSFLHDFKPRLIKAIQNGTKIKIMIADPIKSKGFLERANFLSKQEGKYGNFFEQIAKSIELVNDLSIEAFDKNYSGSIEIRHYHDEYRYNFRLAKYYNEENEEIKAWVNFQPINRDAINLSLTVLGKYDESYLKDVGSRSNQENQSIVLSLDKAFDSLWDKYQ